VDNPLGRVFCGGCGSKLDLSNMGRDAVVEKVKASWFEILWPKALALLVVALLAMVVFAFWPQTNPIGKEGTRAGGQRVINSLGAMAELQAGRALGKDFPEEDINGYFKFFKAEKLKLDSLSIATKPGYFQAHFVRAMAPINLGFFQVQPKFSYDLFCVPVAGYVQVRDVWMGHMHWVGPFRSSIVQSLYRQLASDPDWKALRDLSELKAEQGRLFATVAKSR
jgi:hypothetical protein